MRLLLDTSVVLRQLDGSVAVPPLAQEAILAATELLFSVVSFAEIGIKAAVGKLVVPSDLYAQVLRSGVQVLRLGADHGLAVAELPMHHRDPFDRLLVAQARLEHLTIVTSDHHIPRYDVPCIDAG